MNREQRINDLISTELNPQHLEVHNESHMHHVPVNSETHFKLIIVADKFTGISRINRHRLVNQLLADELQNGLHALSLHLSTPDEWDGAKNQVTRSPSCRDGYKNR